MLKRWFRLRWVRLGGAILVLGLAAALAIPFLIPVDRFRPLLIRFLEDSTGRHVQIDALRLHLVPAVHLQAVNVRLKNAPGFPPGDALLVKSVDLGVEPRPLLSRRVDVTYIALGGVRVNLLRDPSGRTNVDFSGPPQRVPPGTTAPAARGGPSFLTLDRVGDVTIRNVQVTFADSDARRGRVTPSLALSGVNGRIRSLEPTAPDWQKKLEIVADLRGARLATPSLATPLVVRAGRLVFKNGVARGSFSASLGTLRADVSGVIGSLNPFSMTFTVAIPELDIQRLQSLVVTGQGRRAPTSLAAPASQRPEALGEVTIDRLVLPPLEATRMRGRLSVSATAIRLNAYTLSAYGGTVQGAAALGYSAPDSTAAVTVAVRRVDLRQLGGALSPRSQKITGTLEASLTLATTLALDPRTALAGAGTFAVRNGSFPGLDLKSTLARMAQALQLTVPAGDTRFTYFGGDLRISKERVSSTALRLDGEGLEGTGRGSLGFDSTLDYVGTGILKRSGSPSSGSPASAGQLLGALFPGGAAATGIQVPFTLKGTVGAPKFSLAGAPQILRGQSPQQPPAQQPALLQQPALPLPPDLLKLFQ